MEIIDNLLLLLNAVLAEYTRIVLICMLEQLLSEVASARLLAPFPLMYAAHIARGRDAEV